MDESPTDILAAHQRRCLKDFGEIWPFGLRGLAIPRRVHIPRDLIDHTQLKREHSPFAPFPVGDATRTVPERPKYHSEATIARRLAGTEDHRLLLLADAGAGKTEILHDLT